MHAQQGGKQTALTFFHSTSPPPPQWRWRKQEVSSVLATLDPNTPLLCSFQFSSVLHFSTQASAMPQGSVMAPRNLTPFVRLSARKFVFFFFFSFFLSASYNSRCYRTTLFGLDQLVFELATAHKGPLPQLSCCTHSLTSLYKIMSRICTTLPVFHKFKTQKNPQITRGEVYRSGVNWRTHLLLCQLKKKKKPPFHCEEKCVHFHTTHAQKTVLMVSHKLETYQ